MGKLYRSAIALLLLVGIILVTLGGAQCRAFSSEQEAREEARSLYEELLGFKDSSQFKSLGFGAGNKQASAWMENVNKLKNELDKTDYPIFLKIVPGSLVQLGLEYQKTGGAESDFTRFQREELEEELE